jgi:hypothetical protein
MVLGAAISINNTMRVLDIIKEGTRPYQPMGGTMLAMLWKYPEIQKLRLENGEWNLSAITAQFASNIIKKYPEILKSTGGMTPIDYQNPLAVSNIESVQSFISSTIKDDTDWNKTRDTLVPGYRGTPNGIETLPKYFNPEKIKEMMSIYKQGLQLGIIQPIPAETWAMLLLVEGRDDFGFNWINYAAQMSPQDKKIEQQIAPKVTNEYQRLFILLIRAKQQIAKRLGLPFYQAWNGGKQYLQRFNDQAAAVRNPKNRPLVNFIKQAID